MRHGGEEGVGGPQNPPMGLRGGWGSTELCPWGGMGPPGGVGLWGWDPLCLFLRGFRTPDCFYLWGWDSYVLFVGQVTPGGI